MDIITATDKIPIHSKLAHRESVDSGVNMSLSPPSSMVIESSIPSNPIRRVRNKKKKRLASTLSAASFNDLYTLKNEELGCGSYGRVETCVNVYTGVEYAVKIIHKDSWAFQRQKMLKEIELYYLCQGQDSIIQLIEYFEEEDRFYLIFEKAQGGHLLKQINNKIRFSEKHAATIIRKLAKALKYLHSKGIAHRDLKPENVLCMEDGEDGKVASSIRLCDFDLCSNIHPQVTTPRLQSPVGSAEYMAPEVVDAFIHDDDLMYDLVDDDLEDFTYDKSCDLWSLGVIGYTMLCGFLPFNGCCGRDCGWADRNEECNRCQEDLFNHIKRSPVQYPDPYWSQISKEAKDLVTKLLQKNPQNRLEAADILDHPWIVKNTMTSTCLEQVQALPSGCEIQNANNITNDNHSSSNVTTITTTNINNNVNPVIDNNKLLLSNPTSSPNVIRKAISTTHLWSTTKNPKSQNPPNQNPVRAAVKMRRQSSVVEFCIQPEVDYLSRCEY